MCLSELDQRGGVSGVGDIEVHRSPGQRRFTNGYGLGSPVRVGVKPTSTFKVQCCQRTQNHRISFGCHGASSSASLFCCHRTCSEPPRRSVPFGLTISFPPPTSSHLFPISLLAQTYIVEYSSLKTCLDILKGALKRVPVASLSADADHLEVLDFLAEPQTFLERDSSWDPQLQTPNVPLSLGFQPPFVVMSFTEPPLCYSGFYTTTPGPPWF